MFRSISPLKDFSEVKDRKSLAIIKIIDEPKYLLGNESIYDSKTVGVLKETASGFVPKTNRELLDGITTKFGLELKGVFPESGAHSVANPSDFIDVLRSIHKPDEKHYTIGKRGIESRKPGLLYGFPKGGVEGSETSEEALVRELKEEIGFDFSSVERISIGKFFLNNTYYDTYFIPVTKERGVEILEAYKAISSGSELFNLNFYTIDEINRFETNMATQFALSALLHYCNKCEASDKSFSVTEIERFSIKKPVYVPRYSSASVSVTPRIRPRSGSDLLVQFNCTKCKKEIILNSLIGGSIFQKKYIELKNKINKLIKNN